MPYFAFICVRKDSYSNFVIRLPRKLRTFDHLAYFASLLINQ